MWADLGSEVSTKSPAKEMSMLSFDAGLPFVRCQDRPEFIVSLSPRWQCRLGTISVMRRGWVNTAGRWQFMPSSQRPHG